VLRDGRTFMNLVVRGGAFLTGRDTDPNGRANCHSSQTTSRRFGAIQFLEPSGHSGCDGAA